MYDIQNARQRDGDAAENRSDRIDEILSRPRLGYDESVPLPESFEDYDEYPEQPDDLTTPEARQFVNELFASPLVSSIDDAIAETTPANDDSMIARDWRDAFEEAIQLFGGDRHDSGEDYNEPDAESRLAELTGDYPDDMVTPSNPLVVSNLYAGCGLSIEEIAEVYSDDGQNVNVEQIRATLRSARLIIETEGEDSEPSHRLGGTSMSFRDSGNSGVNINSEAVARDPTISVERADE